MSQKEAAIYILTFFSPSSFHLFQHYSPTSFDKTFASQEVEKHQVEFTFWDTSGND